MPSAGITQAIIELDIHGLRAYQASVRIASALRGASRGVYILRIIHGFNRGTKLRDMVYSTYSNHPKVIAIRQGANPGITELFLKKL